MAAPDESVAAETANEVRGEIGLTLGGTPYVLRPSREAIRLFEKQTGRAILQLAEAAGSGGLTIDDAAAIATECIRAAGRAKKDELAAGVNARRIGDLIMEAGLVIVCKRLELLLFLAGTGGYAPSGEVRTLGSDMTAIPSAV